MRCPKFALRAAAESEVTAGNPLPDSFSGDEWVIKPLYLTQFKIAKKDRYCYRTEKWL